MSYRHKFRVWDKAENKYNGFSFHLAMSGELDRLSVDGDLLETDSNRFAVEFCTGLKDKNGKLIYEGDVLQAPGQTIAYKVQWAHHGFVVKAGFSSAKSYPMSNCEMFEIIGNIHEQEQSK